LRSREPPRDGVEGLAQRSAHELAQRRRAGRRRLLVALLALVVLGAVITALVGSGGSKRSSPTTVAPGSAAAHTGVGPSYLTVAEDTSVLPLNVLIADTGNNRLVSVSPRGQLVWTESQQAPGEAFLSRTGRTVIVAQHAQSSVLMRRVDNGRISYLYGRSGRPGSAHNRLSDPRTAQATATGEIVIADLGNCRVLFVTTASHRPVKLLGRPRRCIHHVTSAPITFAHPDAAFPSADGGLVVTEQQPAWVDVLSENDTLRSAIPLHGFSAPSDANEVGTNDIIVTDRTRPGKIVELTATTGAAVWTYAPASGAGELDRPALARVLPDGDVLVADSGNDRVIVIDPKTNAIVWQYGHTHQAGSAPGYLHAPGSVTLVPIGK
jgi:DNA-binding beta-propeller fold protein YncE